MRSTAKSEDLNDISIEEALGSNIDSNSESIVKVPMLNVDLGLSDEALNEAVEYMTGTKDSPHFMESFNNEKLKNFTTIATVSQVARVPGLVKLLNEANALLFTSNDLKSMDMNDLSKLSKSLSEEIRLILDGARKTLETLDKLDAPISANQQLLDKLLQMPDEDIMAMKEYLASRNKDKA